MSVATVTLPGGRTVRLGALPPDPARLRSTLWLHDYAGAATPPPASVDYTPKAAASLARMYLNDTYGDCVIAGKYHAIGVWTGNGSGTPAQADDSEVLSAYHTICGPGDRGCVIADVLDHFKSHGLTAGGRTYKIDDYAAIDHTIADMIRFGVLLGGVVTVGLNLPGAWESAKVWDVTTSRIVGGHDVEIVAYNETGPVVATWGETRQMTWAAATGGRYITEAYVPLSPDWYGSGTAPNGIDVATLRSDLAKLARGEAPDITPTPPPWSWDDLK